MNKLIISIFCSIIPMYIMGQNAFLIGDSVRLFKTSNGNAAICTLHRIFPNTDLPPNILGDSFAEYEYYYELHIHRIENDRALASIAIVGNSPQDLNIKECWVKTINIGISIAPNAFYTEENGCYNVRIYDKPNKNSNYMQLCLEPNTYIAVVTDIHNLWFKIVCIINNQYIVGWIPPEAQCADIFSLCMGN